MEDVEGEEEGEGVNGMGWKPLPGPICQSCGESGRVNALIFNGDFMGEVASACSLCGAVNIGGLTVFGPTGLAARDAIVRAVQLLQTMNDTPAIHPSPWPNPARCPSVLSPEPLDAERIIEEAQRILEGKYS